MMPSTWLESDKYKYCVHHCFDSTRVPISWIPVHTRDIVSLLTSVHEKSEKHGQDHTEIRDHIDMYNSDLAMILVVEYNFPKIPQHSRSVRSQGMNKNT